MVQTSDANIREPNCFWRNRLMSLEINEITATNKPKTTKALMTKSKGK